ncbi:MAG: hypothetical protein Ct9H300mP14_08610 [Gammaproteobacteria bacterium]|nr:MAG: hypothetical protein Ct9H300mP14_08610 [Gammaproteobacteria bacterium]
MYVQHARNSQRSVKIGENHCVLVPAYGSPFVHDLDKGRRYATLEDFENFFQANLQHTLNAPFRWHLV